MSRHASERGGRAAHAVASALALGVVLLLMLDGPLGASALPTSGYNVSYSQSPKGANPNVGLVQLATNYTAGPNLTCTISVAGKIVLGTEQYVYGVYFNGTTADNASSVANFGENVAWGSYTNYDGYYVNLTNLSYRMSPGNTSLTFSVATNTVGPASNFSVNAEAIFIGNSTTPEQTSWLGTNYNNPNANKTTGSGTLLENVVVSVAIVAAVVAVVVVVLVRRRRKPPVEAEEFH
jgi:hypothetical protein